MNINKAIIEKLAEGDHNAFHQVFKAFYGKVYYFALGFIKNQTDADDITQMVFTKLWMKRSMLAEVENIDTYLYTITKNTVLNFISSNKSHILDIETIKNLREPSPSQQEQVEAQDLQILIDMIVSNMPPQRQAVYRMSREEGLTNEEISQKMGIQKKTVENHLNLALGDIRKMLKILILLLCNWG
jgi:RNA polymerase sigma-70 factor (ECF subfamily)